jgi:hypothetical protein
LQGLSVFDHTNLAKTNEKFLKVGEKVLNINRDKYKILVEPFWTIEEWLDKTN